MTNNEFLMTKEWGNPKVEGVSSWCHGVAEPLAVFSLMCLERGCRGQFGDSGVWSLTSRIWQMATVALSCRMRWPANIRTPTRNGAGSLCSR